MKAFFSFIAITTLFLSSLSDVEAKDQYTVYIKDGKKGLINQLGEVIIPAKYEDLGWSEGYPAFTDNVIGYKKKDKWGLISSENKIITPPKYHSLVSSSGYIVASIKPRINSPIKYGVINSKGKSLIPFTYSYLKLSGQNVIARNNGDYGLLNLNNKPILPFIYLRIDSIAVNRFAVQDVNKKVSIVDQKGNSLLKSSIDSISSLRKDFYYIYKNGKSGILSSSGILLFPPEYKSIKVNGNNVSVQSFNKWEIIDEKTGDRLLLNFDLVEVVEEDLFIVSINNKKRLLHFEDSEEKYSNAYDDIKNGGNKKFVSRQGNKQGVIRKDGSEIIPVNFDSILIDKSFIYARKRRDWALYDTLGIKKSVFDYQEMLPISEGRIPVMRNSKWGFINRKGEEIIFPVFEEIYPFSNGLAVVRFHNEIGIIDKEGEWVIYPQKGDKITVISRDKYLISTSTTNRIMSFDGDVIYFTENSLEIDNDIVLESDPENNWKVLNLQGMIIGESIESRPSYLSNTSLIILRDSTSIGGVKKNGNTIIPFNLFDDITSFSEGFMGIKKDGYYGFIDDELKLRISNRYEGIGPFNEGMAAFKLRGKWGFIDKSENIIVQPYYSSVSDFQNGVSIVTKGELRGMLDINGKTVLPVEFEQIRETEEGSYIIVQNGKYGIADKYGSILLYPQYTELVDIEGANFIAKKNRKIGVINQYGENLIPFNFENLEKPESSQFFIAKTAGSWQTSTL